MAIPSQLRERSSAILDRWLRDTFATYGNDAAAAFRRNKDPFTNPVGDALRKGAGAAVEALLDEKEAEEVCSCLEGVIKIRAVQEFSPSEAISFVFMLKKAIRSELVTEGNGSLPSGEMVELEEKIDRVALHAFDTFLRYREQVYELRVNEIKRSVSTLVERLYGRPSGTRMDEDLVQLKTSNSTEAQQGGDQ